MILIEIGDPNMGSVIDTYAIALSFPDYYRYNWDSFEECLLDAVEGRAKHKIVAKHKFSRDDKQIDEVYLSVISDASRDHNNFIIEFDETLISK